ncbi:MAG: GreA/GreB family elongation factor, partial [Limisphaerales bacterium]
LAPLGMAMLGYREGDEFDWPVPAGTIRVRVRKVEREAATTNV